MDLVKKKAAELPADHVCIHGGEWKFREDMDSFYRPDGTLPQTQEEAEIFQAHAYRLAVKCYQPQIPFDIQLKEPVWSNIHG